ncbi:MAG: glutamate dehydrogenase, partial [Actinomycetia bacterium]|nr:glutamate dehydrogenase [Actinomycetes bacterium]
AIDPTLGYDPLWSHAADCAFPSATQNEINDRDAAHLLAGGVRLVVEGANMPTTPGAIATLTDGGAVIIPAKAANSGGVAVSGLEMAQNSMRIGWTRDEVDNRLRAIMKEIFRTITAAAERYGSPDDLIAGANIAGFLKVANAMIDQGVV